METILEALSQTRPLAATQAELLEAWKARIQGTARLTGTSPLTQVVVFCALVVEALDQWTESDWDMEGLLSSSTVSGLLSAMGSTNTDGERALRLARIAAQAGLTEWDQPFDGLQVLLGRTDVQTFLDVNEHGGTLWFSREGLVDLLDGLSAVWVISAADPGSTEAAEAREALMALGEAQGWQWVAFLGHLAQDEEEPGRV
jgi:hypothetical protein